MPAWIAFDAVGTLIFPQPGVAAAYARIGGKFGSRQTVEAIRTRFGSVFVESTAACLPFDGTHILTSEDLERRRWKWIVERILPDTVDPAACFAELYDHFARPENWRLFDDVEPVLRELRRRGYRLALASNYDRRLYDVCRGFPVLAEMDQVVISTEAGACKPSGRFYSALLERCGCTVDEVLMVGDDDEADVRGPTALGMSALRIDRQADTSTSDIMRSLFELLQRLPDWKHGTRNPKFEGNSKS